CVCTTAPAGIAPEASRTSATHQRLKAREEVRMRPPCFLWPVGLTTVPWRRLASRRSLRDSRRSLRDFGRDAIARQTPVLPSSIPVPAAELRALPPARTRH